MGKSKKQSSREPLLQRLLRGRSWGRLLGLAAALVWMFVLGLLVGRGTAPVQFELEPLSRELAELKQADILQEEQRVKQDAAAAGQKTDLEFYEELKKTPSASAPRKKAAVSRKIAKPAVEKPQKKPGPSPGEAAKPAQVRETAPAAGRLTVQAASLQDPEDADALVRRLKAKGYPAFKTVARIPERGIWFRVRVGSFASESEAGTMIKKLKSDGFDPLLVRQE